METGPVALVFFYGVFWSSVISQLGRYRLFETADWFSTRYRRRAVLRFMIAFAVMNLGAVGLLWVLYSLVVPNASGALPAMSAALASLSVFGLHRILHALIATKRTFRPFYSEEEYKEIAERWLAHEVNSFPAHFFPGLMYLIGFPGLALVVR